MPQDAAPSLLAPGSTDVKASMDWVATSGAAFSAGLGQSGFAHLKHYTVEFREWGDGLVVRRCVEILPILHRLRVGFLSRIPHGDVDRPGLVRRRLRRVGRVFRVVLPGVIELVQGAISDRVGAGLEAAPEERILARRGCGRQWNQNGDREKRRSALRPFASHGVVLVACQHFSFSPRSRNETRFNRSNR